MTQRVNEKDMVRTLINPYIPIWTKEDIEDIVKVVRCLRKNKTVEQSCGHISKESRLFPWVQKNLIELLSHHISGGDNGVVEVFSTLYSGRLIHNYDTQQWVKWRETHWEPVGSSELKSLLKDACTVAISLGADPKRLRKGYGINSIFSLLPTARELWIHSSNMDNAIGKINCLSGTWDPVIGWYPNNPNDYLIQCFPVRYDEKALCDLPKSLWGKALSKSCKGQPGLMDFLQLIVGYTYLGLGEQKCLFIYHSFPRNTGKTTFIEAIGATLGNYAKPYPIQALLKRRGSENPSGPQHHQAQLMGARMAISTEPPLFSEWDESAIKALTGGDSVYARNPYARDVSKFVNRAIVFISLNTIPNLSDFDPATQARIIIIPFKNVIRKIQPGQGTFLKTDPRQQQIIFAWGIEGAKRYWKRRTDPETSHKILEFPPCVSQTTKEYLQFQSPLHDFIANNCHVRENGERPIKFNTFHTHFNRWATQEGHNLTKYGLGSINKISRVLRKIGYPIAAGTGNKRWISNLVWNPEVVEEKGRTAANLSKLKKLVKGSGQL